MEFSLYLAKFLGVYLTILGLFLVFRRDFFHRVINNFLENPAIIFWSGISALIFGLLVLFAHPVLEMSWRGLITLYAILAIVKGLMRLFVVNKEKIWGKRWWKGKGAVYTGFVLIIFGLYLSYHGFFMR